MPNAQGCARNCRAWAARHAHTLVEILPELCARPVPITLLHTHGRSAPRRVRAVMTWLLDAMAPLVDASLKPR